ncbi:MAG TPA: hypothetical protein VNE39_08435 [Planctomycetota bacterium]|nr:hypothetical protein [Planctomycetota bacterium]
MLCRATCVALVACLVALGSARADSAGVETITGIVRAAEADAPEAATVKVGDVIYKITKDENGKIVAKEAKDKKAEIKGNVQEKDGVKWITVISAKLVE